ncbi:MAG: helix-turn-helix domain-containing protein [Bryobacteraceae bacterium]
MASIGEKLRSARASLNLTLDEVSASTRISLKYLDAMERDNRSVFPAGFFYRSFVLQYARKMTLDEPAISAALDRVLSSEAPLPLPGQHQAGYGLHLKHITPVTPRSGRFGTGKVLGPIASFVLVVAACAGLYAWWRNVRQESLVGNALRAPAEHSAPPATIAKTPLPAKVEPAPSTPSPLEAQAQPASDPASDSSAVPENAKVSLKIAASEASWLSVSADGKPVFRGILQANESKELGALDRAKLVVGNAGGLSVEWNGKPIGALGRRGQVRVVNFTPEAYTFLDSADRGHTPHDPDPGGGADSTR